MTHWFYPIVVFPGTPVGFQWAFENIHPLFTIAVPTAFCYDYAFVTNTPTGQAFPGGTRFPRKEKGTELPSTLSRGHPNREPHTRIY